MQCLLQLLKIIKILLSKIKKDRIYTKLGNILILKKILVLSKIVVKMMKATFGKIWSKELKIN